MTLGEFKERIVVIINTWKILFYSGWLNLILSYVFFFFSGFFFYFNFWISGAVLFILGLWNLYSYFRRI